VVRSLPIDVQQQLLAELKEGLAKGAVQNPSGWVVKAAKRRGAESSHGFVPMARPEELGVDERATEMLRTLPQSQQRQILDLLTKGLQAGNVHNPSGFVVKKALDARQGGGVPMRSAGPSARSSPY